MFLGWHLCKWLGFLVWANIDGLSSHTRQWRSHANRGVPRQVAKSSRLRFLLSCRHHRSNDFKLNRVAHQGDPLGVHTSRRNLEQRSAISHRVLVQALGLFVYSPSQDRTFAFLADWRPHECIFRSDNFSHHRVDACVWQRLLPQMGQWLLD